MELREKIFDAAKTGGHTYFAIPDRLDDKGIHKEIKELSNNPLVDEILRLVPGVVAVLNEFRQVIAVNNFLLRKLNIRDQQEVLGLRPGEILGCVNAFDAPSGCGTGRQCASCGAAIAIVTALADFREISRDCIIESKHNATVKDYYFKVTAKPFVIKAERFIFLFMEDVSEFHNLQALERVFFHDLKNLINSITSLSSMLDIKPSKFPDTAKKISALAKRLDREVEIQRMLIKSEKKELELDLKEFNLTGLIDNVMEIIRSHPAARDANLVEPAEVRPEFIRSDQGMIIRILLNMLVNAFEADGTEGAVKFLIEYESREIVFRVKNQKVMTEKEQLRVFQRNFTTKKGEGRGLGTYSMKLFGERFLGGTVGFSSSKESGTEFYFHLPI